MKRSTPSSPKDNDPERQIERAVRDGDIKTLFRIIDEFGIDEPGERNFVIGMALKNDQLKVAEVLLNEHSEVNIKGGEPEETLLHIAVQSDATQIVEMLLNRGAHVDARESSGKTPLHYAANNVEIVRLLLQRNATAYLKDDSGSTALSIAIGKNNLAAVKELLKHFNKLGDFGKPDLNSLLCEAAQGSDVAMVAWLLRDTTKVNFAHQHGESPLHCAAKYGQLKMIKLYLDRGGDIDMLDKNGKTVLNAAIQSTYVGNTDFSGHVWAQQDIETTSRMPCLSTVKKMLLFRPNIVNEVNSHTLSNAITKHKGIWDCGRCSMIPIVHALLGYGLTVRPEDAEDCVFMFEAIKHGYFEVVDAVLKLGTDVNTLYSMRLGVLKNITLLHMAVLCYQYEIAEFLIGKGADVNIKTCSGLSPILYAIEGRNQIMAKMLMSTSSAEVTGDHLCRAVENLCPSVVEFILQKYPEIEVNGSDEHGITPLHYAVIRKCRPDPCFRRKLTMTDIDALEARLVMIELLLSAGAYVDSKTTFGMTALHFAASNGYAKVIDVLLKHGAEVNWRVQQQGLKTVDAACQFGDEGVLKVQHLHSCDLTTRDSQGFSPLHFATSNGHLKAVVTLIQFGADVNAKDTRRRTALHLAAHHSWFHITMILLKNGADTHARCEESKLPIDYAEFDELAHEFERYNPSDRCIICDRPCRRKVRAKIQEYQLEAAKMITQKIGDSDVTCHDIIIHSMQKLRLYVRKECIVNFITSRNYYSEFPLYSEMVARRLNEAHSRNRMLLPSLESLNILTGKIFPTEMREKIVDYLSNEDMLSLLVSTSPTA